MFTHDEAFKISGSATAMAGLASLREGGVERILAASRSLAPPPLTRSRR